MHLVTTTAASGIVGAGFGIAASDYIAHSEVLGKPSSDEQYNESGLNAWFGAATLGGVGGAGAYFGAPRWAWAGALLGGGVAITLAAQSPHESDMATLNGLWGGMLAGGVALGMVGLALHASGHSRMCARMRSDIMATLSEIDQLPPNLLTRKHELEKTLGSKSSIDLASLSAMRAESDFLKMVSSESTGN